MVNGWGGAFRIAFFRSLLGALLHIMKAFSRLGMSSFGWPLIYTYFSFFQPHLPLLSIHLGSMIYINPSTFILGL